VVKVELDHPDGYDLSHNADELLGGSKGNDGFVRTRDDGMPRGIGSQSSAGNGASRGSSMESLNCLEIEVD
jgi:hypothetical protein